MSTRAVRSARRIEASGAGPARAGYAPGRWPEAGARFALFGEVLLVGIAVSVLSVGVITIPLALALGVRHLRRHLRSESSTLGDVLADARRGAVPSLALGVLVAIAGLVLVIDLALAADRLLPFAEVVGAAGAAAALALIVVLLTAARLWTPEQGWIAAFRGCPENWRRDPAGVLYLLAAIGLVAVLAWQFVPLVLPGIGCLLLAVVAIPERLVDGDAD
ncbi:hypothetical protein [Planctomonas psychrotolerans]|uniref:hypothetical protein n=1 Tax=Planctomonas psychrotolerans TaxID=2528712 RepID=UPI0012390CDB|nr:hypothetical protein [Planctomonas psychrotolerans]